MKSKKVKEPCGVGVLLQKKLTNIMYINKDLQIIFTDMHENLQIILADMHRNLQIISVFL